MTTAAGGRGATRKARNKTGVFDISRHGGRSRFARIAGITLLSSLIALGLAVITISLFWTEARQRSPIRVADEYTPSTVRAVLTQLGRRETYSADFLRRATGETIGLTMAVGALSFVALGAPFLGVFLAITRHGLWNADLVFRPILIASGLGSVFLATHRG